MTQSSDTKLTPPYFRFLLYLIRPFPNFDLFFVKSLRREAVRLLQLKSGDRVIDGGCGPGGSFPYLAEAVGPTGEVVGVEISPDLAGCARRRITAKGWPNVGVVVGSFATVELEGKFDGLLLLGAPDGYASPQALNNLLPYLADGARVVIFGAKLSRRRSMTLLNRLFRRAFSSLTFSSTPTLDYEPWVLLQQRIGELQVQTRFLGWMFLASGRARLG